MEILSTLTPATIASLTIGAFALSIFVFFISIIAFAKTHILSKRTTALFEGKDGTDLETILLRHTEELKNIDKEIQELFDISNTIHTMSSQGLHKIGIVRFNPFKDIGGDQSFAIALLDAGNSGIVLSSLHTRDGTRIYTKPVLHGVAKGHELSEEEKRAIKIATPTKVHQI